MKLVLLTVLVLAFAPAPALAGANRDSGQDEVGPGPNDGPGYSGFVRDAGGAPVNDARVTATYRDGLAMVTRSNATGAYNLPGYRKGINPDEVKIACAKPGYRQLRVIRKPAPRGQPVRTVETDCWLQRER